MGQYHMLVNFDKREFLHPHELGDGLKLLEQTGSEAGIASALLILLAASNGRGGGDINHADLRDHPLIGSWAGDRIALMGDYAENDDVSTDCDPEPSSVYARCHPAEPDDAENGLDPTLPRYTNITPRLRDEVLSRALEIAYVGDSWMQCFRLWDIPGMQSTHAVGGDRVANINGKNYPVTDVLAEIQRLVKADSRGGFGVDLSRDFDVTRLKPI